MIPASTEKIVACATVMLWVGSGRFAVRGILASNSLSIIWLKPFDDPVIKKPPIINNSRFMSNLPKAKKYPETEESTTKNERRSLSNIAKSLSFEFDLILSTVNSFVAT